MNWRCCQSNENSSPLGHDRGGTHLGSDGQRPLLGLGGRASNFVVVPADAVAVLIEVVMKSGVDGAKFLNRHHASKTEHCTLSSSEKLV